ncbi:MAG: hypothetical protein ABR586_02180 [Thermoplasmatota archaeon]
MADPGLGWVRAARWLPRVAVGLLLLAALLAGMALGSAYMERTCIDPPVRSGFDFGCAWGYGLGFFLSTVFAGVLALAAGAALLIARVARGVAHGDPTARPRAVRLGVAAALVGLASTALHLDGKGPCLQCPLWLHPSTQVVLAGLEVAWRPLIVLTLATGVAAAWAAGRLRSPGLETVK